MNDHIVVDIEIQREVKSLPNGWDDTQLMGVGVACVWESETQRMRVYGPDDVEALKQRLLKADRISGFNIWWFDFPVIWECSRREWAIKTAGSFAIQEKLRPKTNDLQRRIFQGLKLDPDRFDPRTHGGWSLEVVAQGTLGVGKIENGSSAPGMFQRGEWAKLTNYCADDVALERDLAYFVAKYGFVVNGKTGQVVRIGK